MCAAAVCSGGGGGGGGGGGEKRVDTGAACVVQCCYIASEGAYSWVEIIGKSLDLQYKIIIIGDTMG